MIENLDNTLEQALSQLQQGVAVEQIIQASGDEAAKIEPLIRLAVDIRAVPPPQMSPAAAARNRQKVRTAAQRSQKVDLPWWRQYRLPLALAGGLAILTILALFVGGTALLLTSPSSAHQASVRNVTGLVEIIPPAGGEAQFVSNGAKLGAAQRLHTYSDSSATLVFFDGSQVLVGPDTDLTLTKVAGGWGKTLRVNIDQRAGSTTHQVVPFTNAFASYQVNTPAGQVSVHGTIFDVTVSANDETLFAVERGKVQVSNASSAVFLTTGQATTVLPNQKPQAAGYQFTLRGPIRSIQNEQWNVAGVNFHITPLTINEGNVQVGDSVSVSGRILADGSWAADWIRLIQDEKEKARFNGMIEAINAATWQINHQTVQVNSHTDIAADLKVGDAVQVIFTVNEDGSWLAEKIQKMDDEEEHAEELTPTLSTTPTNQLTGTPVPERSATSDDDLTPTVSATPDLTTTPQGNRAGCQPDDKQQPKGLSLSQRYGVPYAEIMGWFCQGYGFGEIDLAYQLSQETGKPVSEIFALRASGLGWGQIKQMLQPKATKEPKPTKPANPTKLPKAQKTPPGKSH